MNVRWLILLLSGWCLTGCSWYSAQHQQTVPISAMRSIAAAPRAAAEQWRIPLGTDVIDYMTPVAPDRLLVSLVVPDASLSSSDLLLVDTAQGRIHWRYPRRREAQYSIIGATDERILMIVRDPAEEVLGVLDAANGQLLWRTLKQHRVLQAQLAEDERHVVVLYAEGKRHRLSVFRAADGTELWNRNLPERGDALTPILTAEQVVVLGDGIEAVAIETGKTLWNTAIALGTAGPVPVQKAGSLYVIRDGRLTVLDVSTGQVSLDKTLAADVTYTNVVPMEQHLYLRGESRAQQRYVVDAVHPRTGSVSWRYADTEPTVSNFVEAEQAVYVATATRLVALNVRDGTPIFDRQVQDTAALFPVHLQLTRRGLTYIGELVVAGYEPASGDQLFWHGVTPLSQGATLASLALNIERYQGRVGAGNRRGPADPASTLQGLQIKAYQNLTSQYGQAQEAALADAARYRQQGKLSDAQMAETRAQGSGLLRRMAKQSARNLQMEQVGSLIRGIGASVLAEMERAGDAATLKWLQFTQQSILLAFSQAEEGHLVYRPDASGGVTSLAVIDGETGNKHVIPLSLTYKGHGLWSLYEPQQRRVIHQGLGLDPKSLTFGELIKSGLAGSERRYNSYLIAQPLEVPD